LIREEEFVSDYPKAVIPVEVRFRDLDAYGHVNNATFLTYLEHARVRILGDDFTLDAETADTAFVMKRVECDFKLPITLRNTIYVRMQVMEMRRSSFTISYDLIDEDETVYATASTILVAINPKTLRPSGIPDWFDAAVQRGAKRFGNTPGKTL
jgi:acyl-CoA thioester hydrolase